MFITPDGQALYETMFQWYHNKERHGTTPSIEMLQARFPTVALPDKPSYPLRMLVTLLVEAQLQRQILKALPELQTLAEVDPIKAVRRLDELRNNLIAPDTGLRYVDLADAAYDHITQTMTMLKGSKGTTGIPFPYDPLTQGTGGARAGKTLFVMAPPKTGKTLFCLNICAHWFGRHNARIAVVVGKEMLVDDVVVILACMLGKISLKSFWEDKLTEEEKRRFMSLLGKLKDESSAPNLKSRLRIFEDTSSGLANTEAIIKEFHPDALYYDALYSTGEDLTWQFQSSLVANFVSLGASTKTFMMASWQAHIREAKNAKIEDSTDYAYTQNIMAKPDCTLKLSRAHNSGKMEVGAPVSRHLPISTFKINYKPGEDMEMSESQKDDPEDNKEHVSLW